MSATAMMIGLDAMEPELITQWADAGHLPTLDSLRRNGATVDFTSPVPGVRAGAWPEVNYGVSVGRTGMFNVGIPQYFPREGVFRDLRQEEILTDSLFWIQAARHGKKVAAIDQVYTAPDPSSDALQLIDWGAHDRPFPATSSPAALISSMDQRYGPYPVQECDALHGGSIRGYRLLTRLLERASEVKANLIADFLKESHWDLVAGMFSEPHCAGHQMWHLYGGTAGTNSTDGFPDALLRVYKAVDAALGRVIEAAGPDAFVVVISSKGMGPSLGGYQLMSEVLGRLGVGAGRRWRRRLWDRVPGPVKSRMFKAIPDGVRDPLRRRASLGAEPGFVDGARALSIRNDQDSAVRLNLVGRDVDGNVQPGGEADRLLDEIRTELLDLRLPRRPDQPIVEDVQIMEETLGDARTELIPDMLVYFRKDIGVIDSCQSDRVGQIQIPLTGVRTGNHTSHHAAWVVGPGVVRGSSTSAQTIDIAPTILSRLGVPIPADLDGKPVADLGGMPS